MSDLSNLCSGVHAIHGTQTIHDLGDGLMCYFILVDYYPVYIYFMVWAIFLATGSMFFYFLGTGMTIDKLLNWTLRYAFHQKGFNGTYQMPAMSSQLSIYILTMMLFFVVVYRIRATTYRVFLATVFLASVVYARSYLHINTPTQLFVGAMVGFLDALVQSFVMYTLLYRNRLWFVQTAFAKLCGMRIVYMMDIPDDDDPIYPSDGTHDNLEQLFVPQKSTGGECIQA